METRIVLKKDRVTLLHAGSSVHGHSRDLSSDDFTRFEDWSLTYASARRSRDAANSLLVLGREMFRWINGQGWLDALLPEIVAPWIVAFEVPSRPKNRDSSFLNAPWELLADESGHLASEITIRWCPVRRLGPPAEPRNPSPYRLSLVFMAAQPRGQVLLDYETEEVAILNATEGSRIDLVVEETGELDQLADALVREQPAPGVPVDVLHLSCHGGFHDGEPTLFLETDTGDTDPVGVRRIIGQPALTSARLLFLSACHSADEEAPLAR